MFEQEGFQFMGTAFEVYNQLGYGMAEEVYQQSLEIELSCVRFPIALSMSLPSSTKAGSLLRGTNRT